MDTDIETTATLAYNNGISIIINMDDIIRKIEKLQLQNKEPTSITAIMHGFNLLLGCPFYIKTEERHGYEQSTVIAHRGMAHDGYKTCELCAIDEIYEELK
ncbi:MAG: hypothetical protein KKF21_19870 [Bacteroidetes bacterium]|nr:hypothetical protein [Bacteroidota bacterium]